ncbi:MAG: hypothetical protein AB7F40_10190 [Victivallaceae bacterium]|nr:hypothetical protein [Victivallaceae bacterium]
MGKLFSGNKRNGIGLIVKHGCDYLWKSLYACTRTCNAGDE